MHLSSETRCALCYATSCLREIARSAVLAEGKKLQREAAPLLGPEACAPRQPVSVAVLESGLGLETTF